MLLLSIRSSVYLMQEIDYVHRDRAVTLELRAPSVSFFCIYSVPYHVFGTYEPDVQKMHDFFARLGKIVLTLFYTHVY